MEVILDLVMFIFSKYRCLIYSAFGNEQYFKVVNQLTSHGVPFRTRARGLHNTLAGQMALGRNVDNTQYDIYVKKEDEYKATQAIQS